MEKIPFTGINVHYCISCDPNFSVADFITTPEFESFMG